MKITPTQRLAQARKASGMTQADLADACGWPHASRVGNYEQGKNQPDLESWELMAKALGVTVNYLLFGEQPEQMKAPENAEDVEIPIFNARGAAGDGAYNPSSVMIGSLTFKRRSLERKGLDYRTLATIYVDGDSMNPTLSDGDVVIFDKSKTTVRHGEVYVLRVDDELLIKRIHKRDGAMILVSDNSSDPKYAPRRLETTDGLEVFGQVVWSAGWH